MTDHWCKYCNSVNTHNCPEKPEGEGWYPLVVANTGDGTPLPRINVKCETVDNGIAGSAFLKVIRVEQEDDGSLTVVIDHWPQQEASEKDHETHENTTDAPLVMEEREQRDQEEGK